MWLLIDIGNTRIKWASYGGNDIESQSAVAHAQWTAQDCAAAFAVLERPERILVSNVGGERVAGVVRDAAMRLWGLTPQFMQSTAAAGSITSAYPVPGNLGVDRWLAIIGAYALHGQALCVVSVGTAATIDGVDASGQHLGGLIIPGPQLMVDSLLHNTSDIAQRAVRGSIGAGLFADNTLGAIHQGSAHAVAALIERAVAAMQAQLGTQPLLLVTGGAGEAVAALVPYPHTVRDDLVMRGLIALA